MDRAIKTGEALKVIKRKLNGHELLCQVHLGALAVRDRRLLEYLSLRIPQRLCHAIILLGTVHDDLEHLKLPMVLVVIGLVFRLLGCGFLIEDALRQLTLHVVITVVVLRCEVILGKLSRVVR